MLSEVVLEQGLLAPLLTLMEFLGVGFCLFLLVVPL